MKTTEMMVSITDQVLMSQPSSSADHPRLLDRPGWQGVQPFRPGR
jgi:hypothetical protein